METTIEHNYHNDVLQSLIVMMLSHKGETQTDRIPVQFIILIDFDMDVTILYLKVQLIKSMCIRNVTSLRLYF